MTLPPPLPPRAPPHEAVRRDWWQRHWKWALPLVGAIPLLVVVAIIMSVRTMIHDSMSDNDAYRFALAQVRAERAVTAALGTPIEPDGLATGSISATADDGFAHIRIPIEGPHGKATVFVDASSRLGVWRFATLTVTIDGTAKPIDLMSALPAERRLSEEERARLMSERDDAAM